MQVQAASDLKSLAQLLPSSARLVLDPGAPPPRKSAAGAPASGAAAATATVTGPAAVAVVAPSVELLMVPTASVRTGDIVQVLPGACGGQSWDCCITLVTAPPLLQTWVHPACCTRIECKASSRHRKQLGADPVVPLCSIADRAVATACKALPTAVCR